MTATEHNKIIGILHLVEGGLQIFGAILTTLFILGAGYYLQSSKELESYGNWLLIFGLIFAPLSLIFAFINLIAGWKVLKEKSGARMWGIVASFISLLNIPLGTAIGIYSLWFLFGVEGKEMYKNK